MILTAAYTGMRWGELAGLRRPNCKLADGRIFVDPDEGNLQEVGGHLTLGPPKTPAAVREILLPPFLIEDGVPEVAQAKRLGHRLPGVRGIYSHVSATVEQRLVDGLQARWEQLAPRVAGDNISN